MRYHNGDGGGGLYLISTSFFIFIFFQFWKLPLSWQDGK